MPSFDEVRQQRYVPDLLPAGSRVLAGRFDLKIDLGCYQSKTEGHIGFDCAPGADADFWCDLNQGIPLDDDCCVDVVAGHFLEHVEDPEFMVYEMWRVCQPGATVHINVPAVSWDGAFAIEHRSFVSEHFFRHCRAFWSLFRLTGMRYQIDEEAFDRLRTYLPTVTMDDAGLMFCNIRRQLLVEAVPKNKSDAVDLTVNHNCRFPLSPAVGPPGYRDRHPEGQPHEVGANTEGESPVDLEAEV